MKLSNCSVESRSRGRAIRSSRSPRFAPVRPKYTQKNYVRSAGQLVSRRPPKSKAAILVHVFRFCCGRQGEPANLISTFLQMHARQFYSLALTRFFSILESSTTNVWNAKNAFLSPPSRVIWTQHHMKVMHSNSADQSNLGVDVSTMSSCMPSPAAIRLQRSSSEKVFPRVLFYFKRKSPVLFDLDFTCVQSAIVDCCSSLMSLRASVFFDLGCSSTLKRVILKRETRALFVLQSLERHRFSIFGVTQTDVSASNYVVPFDN